VKTRWYTRAALILAAGFTVARVTLAGPPAHAQVPSVRPVTSADFVQDAPRGFGDSNNSWAQAMIWWHEDLYVGTTRQSLCTSLFAVWQFAAGLLGRDFANTGESANRTAPGQNRTSWRHQRAR
jgi:hypothetical protein